MEPLSSFAIISEIGLRLSPVLIVMVTLYALVIPNRRRLGAFGRLFENTTAMIGFGFVLFWILVAAFSAFDLITTHDPLNQIPGMKNRSPGTALPDGTQSYPYYLLGGDNLARDVFSRVVTGSHVVVLIAPAASVFAFIVGITLGLPAGYFGGYLDAVLSFMANLVIAFPVILVFYLLVTPEFERSGLPQYVALVLFVFPLIFLWLLSVTRFRTDTRRRNVACAVIVVFGGWVYLSLISSAGAFSAIDILPTAIDLFELPSGFLIVFCSVVLVNSPAIFRIVRGLTLDVKTRDYVAAAQTRGETPWYILLWEILPNLRGPLIVDFCLRIGYVTILLGTLGFFGLGLDPESPDWGSTINSGRQLLVLYPHAAVAPALALLSLVLGVNLLADGLREEFQRV